MPLRALLDGNSIVAPALSAEQWIGLRRDARAGRHLTLPCCGSKAFQRVSPRGLQHFYHAPDADCDERAETLDHLYVKEAIIRGCELAGFEARPEWEGDGWRADVLASRGGVRIAFEAQWSRQTLRDTLQRQERYAVTGVRGCWFFRIPPQGMKRATDERLIAAREDLPLFLLQGDHEERMRVYLNGRHFAVDEFVRDLLSGTICFRAMARVPRLQPITLCFFEVWCPCCSRMSHVYCLEDRSYGATCGLRVPLHRNPQDAARPALRTEVQRVAWAFLQSDEGLQLRLGTIKRRAMGGRERRSFGCFHCDAGFEDAMLWRLEREYRKSEAWTATHRSLACMRGSFVMPRPHWCHGGRHGHCREPRSR